MGVVELCGGLRKVSWRPKSPAQLVMGQREVRRQRQGKAKLFDRTRNVSLPEKESTGVGRPPGSFVGHTGFLQTLGPPEGFGGTVNFSFLLQNHAERLVSGPILRSEL